MNVVFLNTLEKQVEEGILKTAQVSIAEKDGVWYIFWNEPNSAHKLIQDIWYQGECWNDLVQSYFSNLKDKILQGYQPLISAEMDVTQGMHTKSKQPQLLYYYSTLFPNDEVFEELRKWRREQAAKEGRAQYLLATNRILRIISVFLPNTSEELMQIPGFGEHKTNMYSKEILGITQLHEREADFPLDWVTKKVDHEKFEAWMIEQKARRVRIEREKEINKHKFLEYTTSDLGLDAIGSAMSIPRGELVLWTEELDRDGYNFDALIDTELKAISSEEQLKAWHIFETEGDRFLKPVLLRLFPADELKNKEIDRIYDWLKLLRIKFRKSKTTPVSTR